MCLVLPDGCVMLKLPVFFPSVSWALSSLVTAGYDVTVSLSGQCWSSDAFEMALPLHCRLQTPTIAVNIQWNFILKQTRDFLLHIKRKRAVIYFTIKYGCYFYLPCKFYKWKYTVRTEGIRITLEHLWFNSYAPQLIFFILQLILCCIKTWVQMFYLLNCNS